MNNNYYYLTQSVGVVVSGKLVHSCPRVTKLEVDAGCGEMERSLYYCVLFCLSKRSCARTRCRHGDWPGLLHTQQQG